MAMNKYFEDCERSELKSPNLRDLTLRISKTLATTRKIQTLFVFACARGTVAHIESSG